MIKKIRKKITSQDEFGKGVELNIDGDEEHKTIYGGIITSTISLLMLVYIGLLLKKLIIRDDDVVQYEYPDESTEELGPIGWKEEHMVKSFIQLNRPHKHGNQKDKAKEKLVLDAEFYQHVEMYFEQVDHNPEAEDKSKRTVYKRYEARPCTNKDYGEDSEKHKEVEKKFKG